MDTETFMSLASPAVASAVSAYGAAVLTRAEDAAADATVSVGQRIISAVWQRRSPEQQAELERALDDAAQPGGEDAIGALRYQIRRALKSDPQLLTELAALLPPPAIATPVVTVTAERSGIVVGRDNHGTVTTNVSTTPAPLTPSPLAGPE